MKEFVIKTPEDLNLYHNWRLSELISLLDEVEPNKDQLSRALWQKILFDTDFKEIFYEWHGRYFNPHPFPPLDAYLEKIGEYAIQLAEFFPESQRVYWQDFFSQAMFKLSQNEDHGVRFVLASGNHRTDVKVLHQLIHGMLYESSFSPLLNIVHETIDDHHTYIVFCKHIELCRIWIDVRSEEFGIISTWRTQTIPDDIERDYVIDMWDDILVYFNKAQRQSRISLEEEITNSQMVDGSDTAVPERPEPTVPTTLTLPEVGKLSKLISKWFSKGELRDLSLYLSLDYENLPSDTKNNMARELVNQVRRENKVPKLWTKLYEERPHVDWSQALVE